jgi:hypothetical protein
MRFILDWKVRFEVFVFTDVFTEWLCLAQTVSYYDYFGCEAL